MVPVWREESPEVQVTYALERAQAAKNSPTEQQLQATKEVRKQQQQLQAAKETRKQQQQLQGSEGGGGGENGQGQGEGDSC
eukprot:g1173.t1